MWMSWNACWPSAIRRRKSGVAADPEKLSHTELEAVSAKKSARDDSIVGSHTDIMGPDAGTNEQIMACLWTLTCLHGLRGKEIVTENGRNRRHRRQARSYRSRGCLSDRARHEHVETESRKVIRRSCRGLVMSACRGAFAGTQERRKVVGISDAYAGNLQPERGRRKGGRATCFKERVAQGFRSGSCRPEGIAQPPPDVLCRQRWIG